ncbi:MAG: hypothetical protein OSB36_10460, partial [Longimicrobiales bacterium]|nr:hypothetical protein [Longimicrobiales bacterium]
TRLTGLLGADPRPGSQSSRTDLVLEGRGATVVPKSAGFPLDLTCGIGESRRGIRASVEK